MPAVSLIIWARLGPSVKAGQARGYGIASPCGCRAAETLVQAVGPENVKVERVGMAGVNIPPSVIEVCIVSDGGFQLVEVNLTQVFLMVYGLVVAGVAHTDKEIKRKKGCGKHCFEGLFPRRDG